MGETVSLTGMWGALSWKWDTLTASMGVPSRTWGALTWVLGCPFGMWGSVMGSRGSPQGHRCLTARPPRVQAPSGVQVLMSATRSTYVEEEGVYRFHMEHPVPAYLVALVAGDLQPADIGPR